LSGKYAGDYNLITFDGDHTSPRPGFFYDSVCIFFNNNLNISTDFGDDNPLVQEEIKEEDFNEQLNYAPQNKVVFNSAHDELERVKQLSLQDSYITAPRSQQEEEELLELALKLSMMEGEGQKPETNTDKEKDNKTKDTKESDSKEKDNKDKAKDRKDSKSKSKKKFRR